MGGIPSAGPGGGYGFEIRGPLVGRAIPVMRQGGDIGKGFRLGFESIVFEGGGIGGFARFFAGSGLGDSGNG